ncbi:MAG: hypothetical protein H7177_15990 [Rhizobacter sp.]|nr:hypothetical protein [Bacteriovorax sp.]
MRFTTSLLVLCLLVQSCSMNFNNWGRAPSSVANFDDLITKMKNFKGRLMGSEQDSTCSKEQVDADFKKLMASVKRDSCSQDNFSLDKEEFAQKACPKKKIEGYFDKVVKATIAEEKNKKNLSFFQNKIDPQFLAYQKEANNFLKLASANFHNESFAPADRAQLVADYVEYVVLPMRDVVIIMRSYLPKEDDGRVIYEALQPYFTSNFVKALDANEVGLVTQGPNPGSTPFYMELVQADNGTYRLTFSASDIVRRDVLTLLKAPTAKNYVIALKWMTLHMMLSQVYLYETILGNKADIPIPNSCQTHFNGNMPAKFKFNYEDGVGEQFLDNILASHGLTYKQDDSSYLDYYIDNVNKDPTKEGYSGLVPFENYKNALKSAEGSGPAALEPNFDDIAHFQPVMQTKLGEAQSVFRGKVKGNNVTYAGYEIFQKMLGDFPADEIAEIKLSSGEVKQIYPGKQNLSPYVLEVMQASGLLDYSQLVTEKMKKKFVGKQVLIDFPSMYSSPVWRDWSLRYLADTLYQNKDVPEKSNLYFTIKNACMMGSRRGPLIQKLCDEGNPVQNLSNFLSEFRSGEKYIPTRRLEEAKFAEMYPFLGFIWTNLRDRLSLLPEAKPYELNFLLDQLAAGNPWARLKFSYMVALDQLEYQEDGILPQYDTKNYFSKANDQIMCKMNNVSVQYNTLQRAGKVLGLDKPLSYNHAGRLLSSKEKTQVWRSIVDDIQQRNAQLFSVKSKDGTFYKTVENVSYKTILSEQQALSTGTTLSQKAINDIKTVSKSTESQLGTFFLQLYNVKDPVKQQQLFEEFSKVNGIDNVYSMKVGFLALDDAYKKPIYKDLLKQAAQTRKLQVLSQLKTFCDMDINDSKEFKNIFYETTKAQNDLNQMAGLPAVPEEVLSKINEMSPGEWRDMWWGIGSGVAGMAAVVIGGACTTMSGGLCAPLGGAMAVAGLAAMGIQVKLTANEFDRKVESDASEKQVKIMEELGFSNTGSADEVHRSYAWTAFEAISIFPLIGVATRSLTLGPKLVYVSAKSIMRQTGKAAFKAAAKSVTQQEEIRTASYLLGLTSVSKNAGLDAKTIETATGKIAKIKKLYTSGEIDLETMMRRIGAVLDPIKRAKLAMAKTLKNEVGQVTILQTKEQIDKQTAMMMSNYFADNPKEMLRLIQGYSGERLNKSVRIMAEIGATDRIAKRIPVFGGVKDWFLKMRNESLAKNAEKILRIEKELTALGSNPGQLQGFINKNIEDLTDIFIEIPFKKREVPYFIFAQGMPEFNFVNGRKIPLLSMMSEGQTLKRIVTARARLVHETYMAAARKSMGLKRFVQSETTYGAFKSFQNSVGELANRKVGAESVKVMQQYRTVEESIARKLYVKYSNGSVKMEYKAFKEMVFNPVTLKDKAYAEAIWESVPADELLGMKDVGEYALRVVQELSKYNDVDSFERYLGALKVLTINRNPAVLEIM